MTEMKDIPVNEQILTVLHGLDLDDAGISAEVFLENIKSASRATVFRHLSNAVSSGQITKHGSGRNTVYKAAREAWRLSTKGKELAKELSADDSAQTINYNEGFYQDYVPNSNAMLGRELAAKLLEIAAEHRAGREPAGAFMRRILEPMLVGMSWSSSRLEGVKYSIAETRELFKKVNLGQVGGKLDYEAQMLINHKQAIELMVDAAPHYGLSYGLAMQVHKNLMQNLLANENSLGSIRRTLVFIEGTNYTPEQSPHALEQHLKGILEKAQKINNPIESSFFLWTNIAYLQPFEDGNKRTSRLISNIPMLLHNTSPLSFLGVSEGDYAQAMLGVYEQNDVTIARELFEFAYRKSCEHYQALLALTPREVPIAQAYSEQIKMAVRDVLVYGIDLRQALEVQLEGLNEDDMPSEQEQNELAVLVNNVLETIEPLDASYYGVSERKIQDWVEGKEYEQVISTPKFK